MTFSSSYLPLVGTLFSPCQQHFFCCHFLLKLTIFPHLALPSQQLEHQWLSANIAQTESLIYMQGLIHGVVVILISTKFMKNFNEMVELVQFEAKFCLKFERPTEISFFSLTFETLNHKYFPCMRLLHTHTTQSHQPTGVT